MEESRQIRAPVAFTMGKEPTAPIRYAGCVPSNYGRSEQEKYLCSPADQSWITYLDFIRNTVFFIRKVFKRKNSMKYSPYREPNSRSASQEFLMFLCSPKDNYSI
jgi:hypothetical protein